MLRAGLRAPSAGNTQGTDLVVLEGPEQTSRYWDVTLPAERRSRFPWPGLLRAPVLVIPIASPQAYVERYREADKASSGLGSGVEAWDMPYWFVDAAFMAMFIQLAAVDEGLGTLFFGVFDHEAALMAELGVPDELRPSVRSHSAHPTRLVIDRASRPGASDGRSTRSSISAAGDLAWRNRARRPGTDRTVLRTAAYADAEQARRSAQHLFVPSAAVRPGRLGARSTRRVVRGACARPGMRSGHVPRSACATGDPSLVTVGVDLSVGMLRRSAPCGDRARRLRRRHGAAVRSGGLRRRDGKSHAVPRRADRGSRRRGSARVTPRRCVPGGHECPGAFRRVRRTSSPRSSGRAGWWRPSHRFSLDNGRRYLEAAFDEVEVVDFVGELHVPDAEPVMRFARSMRDLSGEGLRRRGLGRPDAQVRGEGRRRSSPSRASSSHARTLVSSSAAEPPQARVS